MSSVEQVDEGVRIRLEPEEAVLLQALMRQMLELLGDAPDAGDPLAAVGIAEKAVRPEDPVLARLFPDAYRDDGEAAEEFRRYTEMGLRDGKREAARTVLSSLESASEATAGAPSEEGMPSEENVPPGRDAPSWRLEAVLDDERAQVWLRALNDVRLALGTRLDVTEEWYEEASELDPRDPRAPMFAVYDWLTMLQESLVRAVW